MRSKYIAIIVALLIVNAFLAWQVYAQVAPQGMLDSPDTPANTQSYTLADIYNRLDSGAAGAPSAFTEPSEGPVNATGHTLDEIMAKAPAADNAQGAEPDEVLAGKTYWDLRANGSWGPQTGTIPTRGNVNGPEGQRTFDIQNGFYRGKTATANDRELKAGNILDGVEIFDVTGSYPAAVSLQTGQKTPQGPRDDGALEKGADWRPATRFEENNDGTVTDNLTGLVWLKNANCTATAGGVNKSGEVLPWEQALRWSNGLASGKCGLSDGSNTGDWRLPNIRELSSLIDFSQNEPALPQNPPFENVINNVQSNRYWSSTSFADNPETVAWYISMDFGDVFNINKTVSLYVWPVRDKQ